MTKTLNTIFFLTVLTGFASQLQAAEDFHENHQTVSTQNLISPQNGSDKTSFEGERIEIHVALDKQAKIGLSTYPVRLTSLKRSLRTVGVVQINETSETHVHSRISGWIEKIHANYVGKTVNEGDPLFELYSPELLITQKEYLLAINKGEFGREIAEVAENRLQLWGVSEQSLNILKNKKIAEKNITFYAPANGVVIEKQAITGMYVTPEMQLYYLADLSTVWVLMTLYEADLIAVKIGDHVDMNLPYDPNKRYKGKIEYIYPQIDLVTRTAKARITIRNDEQFLRPGMFMNIALEHDFGPHLVIVDDAVIDTGLRKIVFVKKGEHTFEPREVRTGPESNGLVSILSGVSAGELVVTRANFLLDAESRLQAALRQGGKLGDSHANH